jgi:hypothetical protein
MAEARYVRISFEVMLPAAEYDDAVADLISEIEHGIQQTQLDYSEIFIEDVKKP